MMNRTRQRAYDLVGFIIIETILLLIRIVDFAYQIACSVLRRIFGSLHSFITNAYALFKRYSHTRKFAQTSVLSYEPEVTFASDDSGIDVNSTSSFHEEKSFLETNDDCQDFPWSENKSRKKEKERANSAVRRKAENQRKIDDEPSLIEKDESEPFQVSWNRSKVGNVSNLFDSGVECWKDLSNSSMDETEYGKEFIPGRSSRLESKKSEFYESGKKNDRLNSRKNYSKLDQLGKYTTQMVKSMNTTTTFSEEYDTKKRQHDAEKVALHKQCRELLNQQAEIQSSCEEPMFKIKNQNGMLKEFVCEMLKEINKQHGYNEDQGKLLLKWSKYNHYAPVKIFLNKIQSNESNSEIFNGLIFEVEQLISNHEQNCARYLDAVEKISCEADVWMMRSQFTQEMFEEQSRDWSFVQESAIGQARSAFDAYEHKGLELDRLVSRLHEIYDFRTLHRIGLFGPSRDKNVSDFENFYFTNYKAKHDEYDAHFRDLNDSVARFHDYIRKYQAGFEQLRREKEMQNAFMKQIQEERLKSDKIGVELQLCKDEIIFRKIANGNDIIAKIKSQLAQATQLCENNWVRINEINRCVGEHKDDIRESILDMESFLKELKLLHNEREIKMQFGQIYNVSELLRNFEIINNPRSLTFKEHRNEVCMLEGKLQLVSEVTFMNCRGVLERCEGYVNGNLPQVTESFDERSKLDEKIRDWILECQNLRRQLNELQIRFGRNYELLRSQEAEITQLRNKAHSEFRQENSQPFESGSVLMEGFARSDRKLREVLARLDLEISELKSVFEMYMKLHKKCVDAKTTVERNQECADKLENKLRGAQVHLRTYQRDVAKREIMDSIDWISGQFELFDGDMGRFAGIIDKLNAHEECVEEGKVVFSRLGRLNFHLKEISNIHKSIADHESKIGESEDWLGIYEILQHGYFETCVDVYSRLVFKTEAHRHTFEQDLETHSNDLESGREFCSNFIKFLERFKNEHNSFEEGIQTCADSMRKCDSGYDELQCLRSKIIELCERYSENYGSDDIGNEFAKKLKDVDAYLETRHQSCTDLANKFRKLDSGVSSQFLSISTNALQGKQAELQEAEEELKKCLNLGNEIKRKQAERQASVAHYKDICREENYRILCSANDESGLVKNASEVRCLKCNTVVPAGAGIVLRECLHEFCRLCMETHIREVKTVDKIVCPKDDCDALIPQKELRALNEYENLIDQSLRMYYFREEKDENLQRCHTPGCDFFLVCEDLDRECSFRCRKCDQYNCIKCKVVHRDGESCDEYQSGKTRALLEAKELKESFVCRICKKVNIDVVFVPCGHLYCCDTCAERALKNIKMSKQADKGLNNNDITFNCPYCKKLIEGKQHVSLPISEETKQLVIQYEQEQQQQNQQLQQQLQQQQQQQPQQQQQQQQPQQQQQQNGGHK